MRLKSVYISEYKNLKQFNVTFSDNNFVDLFVGTNGSGKSNLFEAIIVIFRNLYEFGKPDAEVYFDYTIKYEINGDEIEIKFDKSKLYINGDEKSKPGTTPLPDNILVYYSGQNDTITELIELYEELFSDKIKSAKVTDTRKFIGIGKTYKEMLLSLLLIQPDTVKSKQLLLDKLTIKSMGSDLRLVLKRPDYATGNARFDIENNDNTDKYWKAEGIVKDFLNELDECLAASKDQQVRTEGYLSSDDEYILYYDIVALQKKFAGLKSHELFRAFDNLKLIGMLKEMSVEIKLDNDLDASISHFSDGQFQSVYIFAITELFKESNCITLLDEPDSFLHPEWQIGFLEQVDEISGSAAQTNHVLMSSHSAITLIPYTNKKVKYVDIINHQSKCFDLPKRVAINKLSSNVIKFSEQENLLSILHRVQAEDKPVLFTEGHTDAKIITEAWNKLYTDEMPFIPYFAFSCTYINNLIRDDRVHSEMGGKPVFALFDFDFAYSQWNGLKGEVIGKKLTEGLIKKWENGNSYAFMVPVPSNEVIQKQVISEKEESGTFGDKSCCEIEHLFYGVEGLEKYFKTEPCMGGEKVSFVSDGEKVFFSEEIIPSIDAKHFEIFRPMFEFIKSKCATVQAA